MRDIVRITTEKREQLVDVTDAVTEVVRRSGIRNGLVSVYAQGATGAVMIQENWDQSVQTDVVDLLRRLIPREFFWFLSSKDGLRFRKANTDIAFNIDQPGNDVETLMVASDSLRFFWRRGGALRKVNVFELRREARGFRVREFSYVQGTLLGKRSWELSK